MKMYDAAIRADKGLMGNLAVTTELGYDRPMDIPRERRRRRIPREAVRRHSIFVPRRSPGLAPSPSFDTVIGHSYGSTLVGAAGSDGHHLAAENVIAVAVLACWWATPQISVSTRVARCMRLGRSTTSFTWSPAEPDLARVPRH